MRYRLGRRLSCSDNSFLAATSGIVKDIGPEFLVLTGFSREEFLGRSVNEVFSELLRFSGDTIEQMEQTGRAEGFLFTKALDAREVTISASQGPKYDWIFTFAEKPHSRLSYKFPHLELDSLKNVSGMALYSTDFILLKANQNYIDLLQEPYAKKENCIGRSLFEIFKFLRGGSPEERWRQVAEAGTSLHAMEYEYENSDRQMTYWDASCVPVFENGRVKYIIHSSNEVTEKVLYRKRIEEQNKMIQLQKEHLETIMNNVSDMFFLIDRDGGFLHVNNAAKEFFKISEPKKYGELFEHFKFFDEEGNQLQPKNMPIVRALEGIKTLNEKIHMVSDAGQRSLCISAVPVRGSDGQIAEAVSFCHDITEQVKLEKLNLSNQQQLVKLERDKNDALQKAIDMKDEFLTLISHEFKTPITVIISAIQAMESLYRDELSPRVRGYIERIKQNSYRQLKLANNLLDITRVNSGYIKVNSRNIDIVFLTKAIIESVALYAKQKGVLLCFVFSEPQRIIGIDEEKYERILLNLLSNAIKFTPSGKGITVRLVSKKKTLCLEVADEGVGIPEDKTGVIFERFGQVDSSLTRQAEGTGVGLSITKLFVEVLGGSITVKSKVGKGTSFFVRLPAVVEPENEIDRAVQEFTDERLIQATAIEFSDIYF